MHPNRNYKIFQVQPIQGRNANIAGSMLKKAQLTASKVSDKQQLNPFSGYSYPTNQSSLSSSQVTDFSGSQVFNGNNIELIKKMIKQQLEKKLKDDKQKSDINVMKTQIKSLRQAFQQISKDYNQKLNDSYIETKQQTQNLVQKMMRQHEIENRNNLKKVVSIMRDDMKKQFISYMGRQFIPLSFIDDLQKQLNQIQDRIQFVQNRIKGNQINSKSNNNPVVLAQAIQLRINKIDREIQSIKKVVHQVPAKFKTQQDDIENIIKMTLEQKQNSKFQIEKINSKLISYETEIKKISNIDIFGQNLKLDIQFFKTKLQDIEKSKNQLYLKTFQLSKKSTQNQNNINQLKQSYKNSSNLSNISNSDNFTYDKNSRPSSKEGYTIPQQLNINNRDETSNVSIRRPSPAKVNTPINISYTSPNQNESISKLTENKQQINKITYTKQQKIYSNDLQIVNRGISGQKNRQLSKSPSSKNKQNGQISEKIEIKTKEQKTVYKIDGQGYLMDGDGKYLLSQYNRMILLSPEQIQALQKSELIEFV